MQTIEPKSNDPLGCEICDHEGCSSSHYKSDYLPWKTMLKKKKAAIKTGFEQQKRDFLPDTMPEDESKEINDKSYTDMINQAIKSKKSKLITVSELYKYFKVNFRHITTKPTSLLARIRLTLSANFVGVPRPPNKQKLGKGNYWTMPCYVNEKGIYEKSRTMAWYVNQNGINEKSTTNNVATEQSLQRHEADQAHQNAMTSQEINAMHKADQAIQSTPESRTYFQAGSICQRANPSAERSQQMHDVDHFHEQAITPKVFNGIPNAHHRLQEIEYMDKEYTGEKFNHFWGDFIRKRS
jgi:hypothetical protein